jgi:uracil-DNA glycosylase
MSIKSAGSTSSLAASRTLNSIPFSMSGFQNSLGEEHRNLLKLECEVMGKSWFVFASPATAAQKSDALHRLKLLKDEITKPYFIALKRFLWQEGVRGADDSPKSLRVYPSRKQCRIACDSHDPECSLCSSEHI